MTRTITDEELTRWLRDEFAFATEAVPMTDDGKTYAKDGAAFQLDLIEAASARLPDGRRKHRLIVVEWPRGAGKTQVGGRIGEGRIVTSPTAISVAVAAADQDQAQIVQQTIAADVARSPLLQQILDVQRYRVVNRRSGSVLEILSSDAPSSYGRRDELVIADELALWAGDELWMSLWTTVGKSRTAQMIVLQTPGWDQSSAGYRARELARTTEGYYYSSLEGQPFPPWLAGQIEEQRRTLPDEVFRRLWLSQWTAGSGAFVTRAQLDRCIDPAWRPQLSGRPSHVYHCGLDLGISFDRTARSIMHHDKADGRLVLDDIRVWAGSRDDPVLIADVEADLISVSKRFRPVTFHLDPWQLKSTAQRLSGRLRIKEFNFTSGSVARLSANLLGLLRNGQVRLFADAELENELLRLVIKQTSYGFRIDHRSGGFSDRAMAIGMAAMAAAERLETRPVTMEFPEMRSRSLNRPAIATGSEYSGATVPGAGVSKWR